MKKNVIVSLADANYFPLLDELVDSIKRFKQSEDVAICILDAGLKQDQRDNLSKKVDEIKKAEIEIDTLKQSAPEKINKIAVVTSTEILKKLIGAEVNNSSISAIVDDLVKKNGDKYYGH